MLDIAGELESLGIAFEPQADDKLKTLCPFHDDEHASCIVYLRDNRFHCFTSECKASGDLVLFLAKARKEKPVDTRKYIQQKYGINFGKTLASNFIEDCHRAIFDHADLISELRKRAVPDELISRFRLGFQNDRIVIPITNSSGFYVSASLYSPGAKENKFYALKGYGGNFLYPIEQTAYDKIVIVGGQIKALACLNVLNAHGYGVVSGTTGEGNIEASWILDHFKDKEVWVIMDIDDAGRVASRKVCHMISSNVTAVYDVVLPFEVPKGGPDDFIASGGDLLKVIQECPKWEPDATLIDNTPKLVSLSRAFSAQESGNRVQYKGTVACIGEDLFHVPKTICVVCDKTTGQPECTMCKVVFPSRDNKFKMHPESLFILETAGCSKASQPFAVRDALQIPKTCQIWKHEVEDRYAVEEVRISPELEIKKRDIDREMLPAYILKDDDDQVVLPNETYMFTGRTWPSPRNQSAISVISDYKLVESALEAYHCSDTERLQVFQPLEWTVESLRTKLNHIYEDLEANVCRIFQRRELYLATDLVYHSPLFIKFDGRDENGWTSVLIVGDTSQGKSEVTENLMNHYKLGELVECGQTSAAGVLGGLNKQNGTHFVTWGVLAQHDKRIVLFDELSEAPEGLLGRMNDARSRGVVQVTKIVKGRARARTRTICASNPPRGRAMASYNYGIDAIRDLIDKPQYVRRFDLAVVVDKSEVDSELLQTYRPQVPHTYTSELCNELILWAWTVKDVNFEDEQHILELAVKLTAKYNEDIPLVDKGSMRLKLAKLAAACAARTYSADILGGLYVRKCHVDFVYEFLDKMYSKPTFGYEQYSTHTKELDILKTPDIVLKRINTLPSPRDFVEGALSENNVDLNLILLTSGLEKSEAQSLLSFLFCKNAIRRGGQGGRAFYKSSQFTEYLKAWAGNCCLTEKPEHLKERYDTL